MEIVFLAHAHKIAHIGMFILFLRFNVFYHEEKNA